MNIVLGVLVAAGGILMLSAILWPRSPRPPGPPGLVRQRLAQAGLARMSTAVLVVCCVAAGLAAGALTQAWLGIVPVAIAATVAGAAAPWMLILGRARRNRRANAVVWPDVVDHLVSSLRAGLALPESVAALASVGPAALRPAFEEFARDYRATGDFDDGVLRLKQRLADPVADRIVETLRMARETGGGELTHLLRELASFLRQEAAVRSELEARQSWTVNAARLGVAAPWVVLALLATRPQAADAYNSPTGVTVILVGLVLSVVAYRVMMLVGRLPEEPRRFR